MAAVNGDDVDGAADVVAVGESSEPERRRRNTLRRQARQVPGTTPAQATRALAVAVPAVVATNPVENAVAPELPAKTPPGGLDAPPGAAPVPQKVARRTPRKVPQKTPGRVPGRAREKVAERVRGTDRGMAAAAPRAHADRRYGALAVNVAHVRRIHHCAAHEKHRLVAWWCAI